MTLLLLFPSEVAQDPAVYITGGMPSQWVYTPFPKTRVRRRSAVSIMRVIHGKVGNLAVVIQKEKMRRINNLKIVSDVEKENIQILKLVNKSIIKQVDNMSKVALGLKEKQRDLVKVSKGMVSGRISEMDRVRVVLDIISIPWVHEKVLGKKVETSKALELEFEPLEGEEDDQGA